MKSGDSSIKLKGNSVVQYITSGVNEFLMMMSESDV